MDNESTPRLFNQVPLFLNGLGLNSTDKLVFGCIYTMLNVTEKCFMSNARIAASVEIKTNTASHSIGKLVKMGLLERKQTYKQGTMEVDKRWLTLGNKVLYQNTTPHVPEYNTPMYENTTPLVEKYKDNRLLNKSVNRTVNNTMSSKLDHASEREEIINYLNSKTNKHYKPNASKTKSLINARLKDGFTVNDFKKVIDNKTAEWLNNPKMNKFLRPDTLFTGKFDGYLNETSTNDINRGYEDGASW